MSDKNEVATMGFGDLNRQRPYPVIHWKRVQTGVEVSVKCPHCKKEFYLTELPGQDAAEVSERWWKEKKQKEKKA